MKLLEQTPTQHPVTPWKVAIVTGLSDSASCQLSEQQLSLLQSLRDCSYTGSPHLPHPETIVTRNFPFVPTTAERHSISLIRASMSNGLQYLRTRSESYQRASTPHWESLLQSTERLFLITGSCGLQLIGSWPGVTRYKDRIQVLALGPAGYPNSSLSVTLLQGSRDWVSRCWFRHTDIMVKDVGHLDYWKHPQVREIVQRWIRDRISA